MRPIAHTLIISGLLAAALSAGDAAAAPARKPARAIARAARPVPATKAKPAARTPSPASTAAKPAAGDAAPAGTLKAPYDEFVLALLIWNGSQVVKAEGRSGAARIPPGSYWITSWSLRTKDAAGRVWRAEGGCQGQPQMGVRVGAGQSTEFRLATPLATALTIDQVATDFAFVLQFQGTGGDRCTRVFVDGENPPVPHLKITDADGNLVDTLPFKYGCSFICRKSWKAPEGLKWPLTAALEVDFGPFPVVTGEPIQLRLDGGEQSEPAKDN